MDNLKTVLTVSVCFLLTTQAHEQADGVTQNTFQLLNCVDNHCFCPGNGKENSEETPVVDVESYFPTGDNSLRESSNDGKDSEPNQADNKPPGLQGTSKSENSPKTLSPSSHVSCAALCSLSVDCGGLFVDKSGIGKCIRVQRSDLKRILDEVVSLRMVLGVRMNGRMLPCSFYSKVIIIVVFYSFENILLECMLYYITSHRIASHRIASHHITSHHITSHHITLHYIILYYIILYYIILYYIILYYIILYYIIFS